MYTHNIYIYIYIYIYISGILYYVSGSSLASRRRHGGGKPAGRPLRIREVQQYNVTLYHGTVHYMIYYNIIVWYIVLVYDIML